MPHDWEDQSHGDRSVRSLLLKADLGYSWATPEARLAMKSAPLALSGRAGSFDMVLPTESHRLCRLLQRKGGGAAEAETQGRAEVGRGGCRKQRHGSVGRHAAVVPACSALLPC